MSQKVMRGFLLCGISLILVSCHQKDLLYPGSSMIKITVSFDWEQAPEACPDGMTVVFFPVGTGGKVWRYELPGRDGGDVELPAGTYNMLAFNNDLRYVFFDDVENLFSYRAYTREVPLSWPDNVTDAYPELSGFESFHSPDPLFCGTASDIEVSLCSVVYSPGLDSAETVRTECRRHVIKCCPSPRTSSYTCILRNVANVASMNRGYCLLTGLAQSELIACDVLSKQQAAFSFVAGREENNICGRTAAFGCSSSESAMQWLYLVFVLTDGSVVHYRYDVTQQVRTAPDKRNVTVVINNLELPPTEPSGPDSPTGGFDVAVNDWETIIINHIVGAA